MQEISQQPVPQRQRQEHRIAIFIDSDGRQHVPFVVPLQPIGEVKLFPTDSRTDAHTIVFISRGPPFSSAEHGMEQYAIFLEESQYLPWWHVAQVLFVSNGWVGRADQILGRV